MQGELWANARFWPDSRDAWERADVGECAEVGAAGGEESAGCIRRCLQGPGEEGEVATDENLADQGHMRMCDQTRQLGWWHRNTHFHLAPSDEEDSTKFRDTLKSERCTNQKSICGHEHPPRGPKAADANSNRVIEFRDSRQLSCGHCHQGQSAAVHRQHTGRQGLAAGLPNDFAHWFNQDQSTDFSNKFSSHFCVVFEVLMRIQSPMESGPSWTKSNGASSPERIL